MNTFHRLSLCVAFVLAFTVSWMPATAQQANLVYWPTNSWQSSTPEEQGMDSAELLKLVSLFDGRGMLTMHNLLVIRHGYIVLDASTAPYQNTLPHELNSATTSFISTLVGIAIQKGYIQSVDQSIWDFFPKEGVPNMDSRKEAIQIRHLLTMSSGLGYAGVHDAVDPLYELGATDTAWVDWMLGQKMWAAPGERFFYNDGQAHLVSALLQRATGQTALEFAQANLFTPLGIHDVTWLSDPQGVTRAARDLFLRPDDMAKLGYLFAHNGLWEGRQIVPSEWVQSSTQVVMEAPQYGYYWWVQPPLATLPAVYAAMGYGGQMINVIADQDVVMVLTGEYRTYGDAVRSVLANAIISDEPLPPNPQAYAQLQSKIASLQNPLPVTITPVPEICASVNGKMYNLPENSEGWLALGLRCDDQQATLLLQEQGELLEIPIGLDGEYQITNYGLPQLKGWMRPVNHAPVAARGNWGRNNTFSILLRDLLGMQEIEVVLRFKDGLQVRLFEHYANAANVPFYLDLSGTEIVPT